MIRTIIFHDREAAHAEIKFEHAGVIFQDIYDLIAVVPGTSYLMEAQGITRLPDEAQDATIEFLTGNMERMIDAGAVKVLPVEPAEPQEPEDQLELPL